jgi:UDP-MurNAc hydroxylase
MQITFHTSASVIIEDNGTKILTDPWFIDGEFYGSWAHYPPYDFNSKDFEDIDYIYISHIHPDHCSVKTLEQLDRKIPILIHNFHFKYLKDQIQRLGFSVIELNHNERIHLKNNLHIRILAADNCNPEICKKYFGCGLAEQTFGSTSIDSMCVIDNNDEVIVNTNDCPFELGETSASIIKKEYGEIDFLLLGYSSATAYPQCFELNSKELTKSQNEIILSFLSRGESYVNLFSSKYFMPFAGRYVLSGKNHALTWKKATPELEEATNYFNNSQNINHEKNKCIILNSKSSFNITTGKISKPYTSINLDEKKEYVSSILSKYKYDYEYDSMPTLKEIESLISKSYERFEQIRNQLNFSSDTKIIIDLPEQQFLVMSSNGTGYEIMFTNNLPISKFLRIQTDPKLLKRLLQGPKFAHWNNAEIGSHLMFKRMPNVYERGLFYCLNFFHA